MILLCLCGVGGTFEDDIAQEEEAGRWIYKEGFVSLQFGHGKLLRDGVFFLNKSLLCRFTYCVTTMCDC